MIMISIFFWAGYKAPYGSNNDYHDFDPVLLCVKLEADDEKDAEK